MGLTEQELRALPNYASDPVFIERERAVLKLADALSDTPAHIDDELFAELRTHFDDEQLSELASALAWENYRARFNRVFDIEAEGFSEGAFCPLPVRR